MSGELYKKFRPTEFDQVVGQPTAVQQLSNMVAARRVPHAMLFTGPSGCGKTTLARILRVKIGCGDGDFIELNAAKERGIDMVRSISQKMGLAPISGRCRVFLIDEAHQLTKDAQGGMLKMLEDTPKHVYFFVATTEPTKLQTAIRTRCTEVATKGLNSEDMKALLVATMAAAGLDVVEEAIDKIIEIADGSARRGLVMLEQVSMCSKDTQVDAAGKADGGEEAIDLARALLGKATWKDIATKLKGLKEQDTEGMRRLILAYANSVLLSSGNGKAYAIIDSFARNFFDSGYPGFCAACYEVVNAK